MKKLFTLKKWLTLQEAARYLTIVFGEEVREADVLRLALDGHLKLSVNFVNHARARKGEVVPIEEAKYTEFLFGSVPRLSIPEEHKGKPIMVMRGINLDDKRVLNLDSDVVTLNGVYDLVMLGNERLDIEHKYQMLTKGPSVTLHGLDGAFVTGDANTMYQIQESYDENEYQTGSNGSLRELEKDITLKKIKPEKANELLAKHKENRKIFLAKAKERRDSGRDSENYHPAGGLPGDGVIVVRTDALRAFVLSLDQQLETVDLAGADPIEKPADPAQPTKRQASDKHLPGRTYTAETKKDRGSTVRRDARKLDTQAMYKQWQKAYLKTMKERPNMSDIWYSRHIAKMEIAKKRNAETIRKHMKS